MLGRILGETAPAAADIEHPHAGLELDFSADQVQFCLLRLVERCGLLPITTAVDHTRIQHFFVQVVPDIVVSLADVKSARPALLVDDLGDQHVYLLAQRDHFFGQAGPEHFGQALVERLAVPPAVHVGFPQSERARRQNPVVKLRIMDVDVPRTVAVNLNIRLGEEILHGVLHGPVSWRCQPKSKTSARLACPEKGDEFRQSPVTDKRATERERGRQNAAAIG